MRDRARGGGPGRALGDRRARHAPGAPRGAARQRAPLHASRRPCGDPGGAHGRPRVALVVWDKGPGIPAKERAHVFERFRRGSAAEAIDAPGNGLGLAIVKSIVEAHGAAIELRDLDGGGLEAVVTLAASATPREMTA